MKNRKGIAVVIVIFFAFAISIIMFTMFQSNSNLTSQTKRALYQMQAFYLAQSCVQLAKLHIYLLPKEMYDYYENTPNSDRNALSKCDSTNMPAFHMGDNDVTNGYDLFNGNNANGTFPYEGRFKVEKLVYLLSNQNMKMTQDSYHIEVESYIKLGKDKEYTEKVNEDFIVSRFIGR